MAEPLELRLASGLVLRGLAWGPAEVTPIVCLHGWLDNAMSFAALAAELPSHRLIALDWPGHGLSDHRPAGAWYHFIDYVDDLGMALDALGLARATLLGHSLGGAVASVFAAARPECVERLLVIEGMGPLGSEAERAVEALRKGLDERRRHRSRGNGTVYPDLAAVVAARARVGGMSLEAAKMLVSRGLEQVEGGFRWRSDPRLTVASPNRFGEARIRAWLAAIACPTLLILAEPPMPYIDIEMMTERLRIVPGMQVLRLPGHHHLHMDDPAPVAAAIRAFLEGAA
ncbi:MAG TPA: alpha/beta hydrolase [Xanthomonadaceae bacterium]|nr:alpha/beta hydrolase [Xanthomonadaceae bacterium]